MKRQDRNANKEPWAERREREKASTGGNQGGFLEEMAFELSFKDSWDLDI